MANVNVIIGDQKVTGDLTVTGIVKPPRTRAEIAQTALAVFPLRLSDFKVWDAQATNLPTTGGTDDLGLYTGTWGTHTPKLSSGDVKASGGAVTRRAAIVFALPAEYDAGETITIRISAATETTISDAAVTVDVEVYAVGRDGTIDGSDLITTSATSINSTTWANKDFVMTPTGLEPGDEFMMRVTLASNDVATGTTVQPSIGAIELLCDIRG